MTVCVCVYVYMKSFTLGEEKMTRGGLLFWMEEAGNSCHINS